MGVSRSLNASGNCHLAADGRRACFPGSSTSNADLDVEFQIGNSVTGMYQPPAQHASKAGERLCRATDASFGVAQQPQRGSFNIVPAAEGAYVTSLEQPPLHSPTAPSTTLPLQQVKFTHNLYSRSNSIERGAKPWSGGRAISDAVEGLGSRGDHQQQFQQRKFMSLLDRQKSNMPSRTGSRVLAGVYALMKLGLTAPLDRVGCQGLWCGAVHTCLLRK